MAQFSDLTSSEDEHVNLKQQKQENWFEVMEQKLDPDSGCCSGDSLCITHDVTQSFYRVNS